MKSVTITPDTIAGFERWLTDRGCYAPGTIRAGVTHVRAMAKKGICEIPLNEDDAVALVDQLYWSRTQADNYKAAIRRLIECCRAEVL
jgi:hypothetical protein